MRRRRAPTGTRFSLHARAVRSSHHSPVSLCMRVVWHGLGSTKRQLKLAVRVLQRLSLKIALVCRWPVRCSCSWPWGLSWCAVAVGLQHFEAAPCCSSADHPPGGLLCCIGGHPLCTAVHRVGRSGEACVIPPAMRLVRGTKVPRRPSFAVLCARREVHSRHGSLWCAPAACVAASRKNGVQEFLKDDAVACCRLLVSSLPFVRRCLVRWCEVLRQFTTKSGTICGKFRTHELRHRALGVAIAYACHDMSWLTHEGVSTCLMACRDTETMLSTYSAESVHAVWSVTLERLQPLENRIAAYA
jgi:hypothetical protein